MERGAADLVLHRPRETSAQPGRMGEETVSLEPLQGWRQQTGPLLCAKNQNRRQGIRPADRRKTERGCFGPPSAGAAGGGRLLLQSDAYWA